jgi:hypothetical protein
VALTYLDTSALAKWYLNEPRANELFLVPTLRVGMPARTRSVLQERSRTIAGRSASENAFPRGAWER